MFTVVIGLIVYICVVHRESGSIRVVHRERGSEDMSSCGCVVFIEEHCTGSHCRAVSSTSGVIESFYVVRISERSLNTACTNIGNEFPSL